jgi:hypothetical protein
LFFVHQAINGEHAATEIFNLRLQCVFNPLWICWIADTFDEFTALRRQLLVGFFTDTSGAGSDTRSTAALNSAVIVLLTNSRCAAGVR